MKTAPRHQEIEIKLRVPDLSGLRGRLKHLRAREISSRTHESNTLYDTPRSDLRRRGELIRVRIEQSAAHLKKNGGRGPTYATLTFKAPIRSRRGNAPSDRGAASRGQFKIREEAEISLVGADQMDRILRGVGLLPTFRYEKYRTTYALPGIKGLKVELDETPVGIFLELEGSRAVIVRAATLLGYGRSEYITETYGALYIADCRRRGRKPRDMLFP